MGDIILNGIKYVGGGGSGGHTIIDPLGQDMPQRTGLQIIGASVTDDSVNDKTVVTITGGGSVNYSLTERVIGTWTDGKPLYECTYEFGSNLTCSSNTWTNTPIPNTDLKRVVSAVAYDSSGTVFQFIGANCNSGNYVQFLQTRNAVIIVSGATLRYTKTTD